MDAGQISVSEYLRPLKISLPSVRHITIEINQTCNIGFSKKNQRGLKTKAIRIGSDFLLNENQSQIYREVYHHLEQLRE